MELIQLDTVVVPAQRRSSRHGVRYPAGCRLQSVVTLTRITVTGWDRLRAF